MRVISRVLFVLLMFVAGFSVGRGQNEQQRVQRVYSTPTLIGTTFGLTVPQGRIGLREYWLNGPGGSLYLQVFTDSYFSIGGGVDFSLLYFNQNAFAQRFPGVNLREKQNLTISNIYIDATVTLLPTFQTRPFLSVQVGAELISKATFQEYVGGVRTTYYDVGGTTRLAIGAAAGAVISLNRSVGIRGEVKAAFVHNDPNVSMLLHARAGMQIRI